MSTAYALSDARVMATLRKTLAARPGGLLHRAPVPVMLMLLFVYVFGRAMSTGGRYVDYVVPGLIVLRRRWPETETMRGWVRSTASSTTSGAVVVSYRHRPHTGRSGQTALSAHS